MDKLLHSVLIDYWHYSCIICCCLVVFVVTALKHYNIWRSSTFDAEKNKTVCDETGEFEKLTTNENNGTILGTNTAKNGKKKIQETETDLDDVPLEVETNSSIGYISKPSYDENIQDQQLCNVDCTKETSAEPNSPNSRCYMLANETDETSLNGDRCSLGLSIPVLEKELAECREQEHGPPLEKSSSLTMAYSDQLSNNAVAETNLDSVKEKSKTGEINDKKSYAAFLIDRPFDVNHQSKKEDEITSNLRNCLRYRLRIAALNLETSTEKNTNYTNVESDLESALCALSLSTPSSSRESSLTTGDNKSTINSSVNSLYETLLQLIDEYDATGIAEIFRLLLERRCAIPLFVPKSKKHFLSLLRHITLSGIDNNIRLGEDKSLLRVAVVSCRQRTSSQTCDILKSIFNIESIHSHDFTTGNVSSEIVLTEIGCGCILKEDSGSQIVQNVLVVHVIGDFRPLWPFLRRFADCFLIEDSTVAKESFFSSFMTEKRTPDLDIASLVVETSKLIGCIWKPSSDGEASIVAKKINGFEHFHIQGQLSGKTPPNLKLGVGICMKNSSAQPNFANNRRMLCEIPILDAEGYRSLECVSPAEIESSFAKSVTNNLANVKKYEFLLQKTFLQEAKHEDAKMENRLNEEKVREEDEKIKVIRAARRSETLQVQNNTLLQLFLSFLEKEDCSSRVLSIRMLEKELAKSGELELGPLLEKISSLTKAYSDQLSNNAVAKTNLDSVKENLRFAKSNLIESVLNIEHLWRELSHLYTDMEPKSRSEIIKKIPRLAAQHLLDGFSLELLDGDSNMIRMEWVKEVLSQLEKLMNGKRIFVLSVMGVQSSGKSTMLNTMFGIRMRTSVGQCTRGVNMQLLAVEGRPEYDYILLLDTEGTRSSEFHGLAGSEKRDNQMATLNILLADATIVVIPGENDAAVKEILPIVLMAYQGSQLAEDNGGRLSSRMFFVYNRIDTKQKTKLDSIIQTLGTSLHEAFSQVQQAIGDSANLKLESPFANFNLVTSDPSGSDVSILGNVKKQSEPPGDVPDEKYGEGLIQFREHIHRRVTNSEGGGKIWKSRSIEEFSSYIERVWKCICSANFIFNFATVMEHMTFDKLDLEYKQIERKLAEAYEQSFKNVKEEMIKSIEENKKSLCTTSARGIDGQIQHTQSINQNSSAPFKFFEDKLCGEIYETECELNNEVDVIVNKKGQEKWSLQFKNMWENKKKDQAFNWKLNLKNAYDSLFNYEYRVETYKKKMRKEINQFFKSSTNSDVSNWTEDEKNTKFDEMFKTILDEAKKEFPPKDVPRETEKVYQDSNVIKTRKIEIKQTEKLSKKPIAENKLQENKRDDKKSHGNFFNTRIEVPFKKYFTNTKNEAENTNENSIRLCFESVHDTVNRIAAGKLCYDDSIISNVIRDVNSNIKTYYLTDYSVVQQMHDYGKALIVELMTNIEKQWERENSVPAKFESEKEILRQYFMMVSEGVAKTQLFAATMAATLEKCIIPAFEKEMVRKTFQGIRKERWLYDARFMQKHMDLYLIDLLEKKKLDDVLDNIRNPKEFYAHVLHRLIAEKVPIVDDEWQSFKMHLEEAVNKAAAVEVDTGRAQSFVDQLRKEFFEGYLQSETLSSAFRIDCSGEYENCDDEEKKEFYDACSTKLKEVLEKQVSIGNQENYAKELSPKVVQYMITLNDEAALPRCDVCCRMCMSLCIEAANHDTQLKPHDAVHQPAGVAGINRYRTYELESWTCNQCFEQDRGFYLGGDYTVLYKYRDFATVFPGWKDPRINEELPVREYILSTYNKEIAEKYKKNPAKDIPASYFRDLSSIKEKLQREIEG